MRTGEKGIAVAMILSVVIVAGLKFGNKEDVAEEEMDIPFVSDASPELANKAGNILRTLHCRECHFIWGTRDLNQAVPAPAIDGVGEFRDEAWLFNYLSQEVPQDILPSRLKPKYRMPSYAHLSVDERQTLAKYLATLKVKGWYLKDATKKRYEKITGNDYTDGSEPIP